MRVASGLRSPPTRWSAQASRPGGDGCPNPPSRTAPRSDRGRTPPAAAAHEAPAPRRARRCSHPAAAAHPGPGFRAPSAPGPRLPTARRRRSSASPRRTRRRRGLPPHAAPPPCRPPRSSRRWHRPAPSPSGSCPCSATAAGRRCGRCGPTARCPRRRSPASPRRRGRSAEFPGYISCQMCSVQCGSWPISLGRSISRTASGGQAAELRAAMAEPVSHDAVGRGDPHDGVVPRGDAAGGERDGRGQRDADGARLDRRNRDHACPPK